MNRRFLARRNYVRHYLPGEVTPCRMLAGMILRLVVMIIFMILVALDWLLTPVRLIIKQLWQSLRREVMEHVKTVKYYNVQLSLAKTEPKPSDPTDKTDGKYVPVASMVSRENKRSKKILLTIVNWTAPFWSFFSMSPVSWGAEVISHVSFDHELPQGWEAGRVGDVRPTSWKVTDAQGEVNLMTFVLERFGMESFRFVACREIIEDLDVHFGVREVEFDTLYEYASRLQSVRLPSANAADILLGSVVYHKHWREVRSRTLNAVGHH